MSANHARCDSTGSTETAATLVSRAANSSRSRATAPSSVVHTGVKSAGWESSTPQESPSHSWKRISPSAVWAVKSGARSPRFKLTAPAGAGGATGRAERSGNRDEVDVDTGAKAHIFGLLAGRPRGTAVVDVGQRTWGRTPAGAAQRRRPGKSN